MASTSSKHPPRPSPQSLPNMNIHPQHQGRAPGQSSTQHLNRPLPTHHHQQQHHPSAGLPTSTTHIHHPVQAAHQLSVAGGTAPSFPTFTHQYEPTSLFSLNSTQAIPPLPLNLISTSQADNASSPVSPHALVATPTNSSPMFQRLNVQSNSNDLFTPKNGGAAPIPPFVRNQAVQQSASPLFDIQNDSNPQNEMTLNAVTGEMIGANALARYGANSEGVNRNKRSREEISGIGAPVLQSARGQCHSSGVDAVPSASLPAGFPSFPIGASMGRSASIRLPLSETLIPSQGATASLAPPGSVYGVSSLGVADPDGNNIGVRYKTPVEDSASLRAVIERNENNLSNCNTLKKFLKDTEDKIQRTPGLAGEMWQGPLGSKRNMHYRYPRGEDDVEVLLDEASVLEDSWYARLKETLAEQLDEIRQSAFQTEVIMERKLDMQRQYRAIPMEEVDRRMEYCRAKFLKCRLAVLEKFKTYVRALKWVHLSPLRQRRGSYSRVQNNVLRLWLFQHFADPYPSQAEKQELMTKCQMNDTQISNWMINSRVRIWKPCLNAVSQSQAAQETVRQLEEKREQKRQIAARAKRMRAAGSMDVGGTSSADASGHERRNAASGGCGGAASKDTVAAARGIGMGGGRRGW